MSLSIYSVAPFSGPKFRQNERKLKEGETPCAICGKAVSHPYRFPVTVVGGGDWARTEAEEAATDDPGYMGVWGVGPDCHRKYLVPEAANGVADAEARASNSGDEGEAA